MVILCKKCGAERQPSLSKVNLQKYLKQYPICRRCGALKVKDKISRGWFKKGTKPWNKNKIGVMPIPWNKGDKGKKDWMNLDGLNQGHGWNKGLPFMQDEKHPNWKGDNVGYNALHSWIQKKLGKPSKCDKCKTIKAKRFEWANISGKYMRDLNDWKRLCAKCHANEHKNWEARWHVA